MDHMINEDLKKLFHETELCQHLTETEINLLLSHSQAASFKPNEIILKQGSHHYGMYFLLDGSVKISAKVLGESPTDIVVLSPGNFFGEISAIEKKVSAASVHALTDVFCIYVPNQYFDTISYFFPETKYKLLQSITKNVCDRLITITNKVSKTISQSSMQTQSFMRKMYHSFSTSRVIQPEEAVIGLSFLRDSYLFHTFSQEEFLDILNFGVILETSKHFNLISKGDQNTSCYVVLSGAVQSVIVSDHKFAKLAVLGPLKFFSSIYAIDKKYQAIIDYTTCERAMLLKLPDHQLNELKKKNIFLWYKIFNLISHSMIATERAMDKLDVRLKSEIYNR